MGLFAAGALAGLADFYRWGYDYGHNLDPEAIIKIPGMSYQPPLIGTKQLLNFQATSWPASGGWILIAALCWAAGWRCGNSALPRPCGGLSQLPCTPFGSWLIGLFLRRLCGLRADRPRAIAWDRDHVPTAI